MTYRDERPCVWCDHESEVHARWDEPRRCEVDGCGCLKFAPIPPAADRVMRRDGTTWWRQ